MTAVFRTQWNTPGPVSTAVYNDWRSVVADMGPIGCGKTTTFQMKWIHAAIRQRRSKIDGMKKFKLCVVAADYRRLWKNLIPSWTQRLPTKGPGIEWKGGEGEPATHHITFDLPTGRIDFHADFIAIGDKRAEDVLRGYEPTAFWLTEADLLSEDVFNFARGRAGRYPRMEEGGPTWYGIGMDFNAPDVDNWIYTKLYEHRLEYADWFGFHRQPSGFSPQAENLISLPPGYYENQGKGQPDWYVRRMIRNEFGYSREGKPVYEEFSDVRHVAAAIIEPVRGIPLRIGADAGLTPAATIRQHMPNGQQRVLAALAAGQDESVGPTRFAERLNRLLATPRFAGFPRGQIIARCDPTAQYGGDETATQQSGDRSWMLTVKHVTGIDFKPARTNDPILRMEAVRRAMTRDVDRDVPGFIVSPDCRVLIKAYASDYRFRRVTGGSGGFTDKPDKNQASHVADADQYAALTDDEYLEVIGRKRPKTATLQTRAIDDSDPEQGAGKFERRNFRQTQAEE